MERLHDREAPARSTTCCSTRCGSSGPKYNGRKFVTNQVATGLQKALRSDIQTESTAFNELIEHRLEKRLPNATRQADEP